MAGLENTIKQFITSLLTSTPLVVTMQQLNKDYMNTIGEPIPYQKLGYNSLEHFLRSINDTVQVNGSGPTAQVIPYVSELSAHVHDLVIRQKVNTSKRGRGFQVKRTTYNSCYKPPSNRKIHYPSVKESMSSSQSNSSFDCVSFATKTQLDTSVLPVPSKVPFQNNAVSNVENQTVKLEVNKDIDIPKTYGKHKIPTKKLVNKTSPKVDPKKCSSVKNILKNVCSDKNKTLSEQENRVPYHIRNNLRVLISQCPEGIWCAEMPEKYRKMFRQELNYQELGFNSLIDLCVCLASVFHYVRPTTEDFKLYDKSRPLPECAEKKFTVASYGTNKNVFYGKDPGGALPEIEWYDVNNFLPQDILKPGEEIPRTFVPSHIQENDIIEVVVGEIFDLSKFWVYLVDSPLDKLMDDIQDFYKEHASEYEIPQQLFKEGLYCVQVIFGEYHRGLIVDTMPDVEDMVRVIFIDYGTMTKISTKGMCFLHTKFASVPAQAIRCRLANMFPLEEGAPWSKEATKAFRKLVGDRDTSAKIHYINREEQYIEVYLADSSDENNVFYINDKLVEEGFAQYTDKDRLRPLVSPIYTPIVKLIHLFPTFLELEHGLAPSTAEMEIFQECNVAINFCYPQYFYVDYSFEEEIIRAAEEFHETVSLQARRRSTARFYDFQKVQPPPLDLTIFGELEAEISAFLRKSGDESRSANSDEDFVDADEESLGVVRSRANNDAFGLLTEQLKALNAKEEETVNVLRRDLRVTEDIMKDINLICKIQNWSLCVDEVKKELPEVCCDLENTATCNEGEFTELETQRELWTINETRESIDTQDSVACVESPTKSDGEIPFNHPLSKMSFDKDSETDEDHNSPTNLLRSPLYELQEPDVKLEPVDFSLAENTTEPDNVPSGDVFISKISDILLKAGLSMADSDYNSEGPSNSCHVKSEASFITSTNPFLNDTNDSRGDLTIDKCISNPNNPFLTFLDDAGSGSTSLAVEVKSVHAWSEFDDMSAETISELGRTLSSKSSSSSSVRVTEDGRSCSISTQTSGQHVGEAKTCNVPNYPPYFPPQPPQPMAYYSQWSLGYTNPYYLRFGNPNNYQHGYHQGLPFRGPPGFPPPPGFGMPVGPPVYPPVGPLMGPTRMPNYRNVPPRMADKFSGGRFPEQCLQPCYGSRSFPAPPQEAAKTTAAASAVSESVAGNNRDFYDVYNEQLKVNSNEVPK